ncbi:YHS domain-containing protein [Botrimarina mediterranea]|uniref:YHS domain-containing protein n=1 Tax=Botrimarina mediterranea TaxID=2528022 RepID=UPI001187E098|nr:YHS domain protein [Planctomycetes bacterium K2D]
MDAMDRFKREVDRRLSKATEREGDEKTQLALEMAVLAARHEEYDVLASKLIEKTLLPRVLALSSRFENAEVQHVEGRCLVSCRFRHSARFPATVELQMGVTPDERIEKVVVYYDLSILPIFMKFQKHDQVIWDLDDVDEEAFTSWVESHLVSFLETYLRIEEVDQYQQGSLCTDPVCGMRIRKSAAAATANYDGATFYFCVEGCRDTFVSDPKRYVDTR